MERYRRAIEQWVWVHTSPAAVTSETKFLDIIINQIIAQIWVLSNWSVCEMKLLFISMLWNLCGEHLYFKCVLSRYLTAYCELTVFSATICRCEFSLWKLVARFGL
jgi:hypothetical protein